jgi:nitrogen fixation protein FixH
MTTALAGRSRYIPWLFVAGFVVVIAVNAMMIWLAIGSFSGLYTPKPRDIGLRYNAVIAEGRARDALGWHVEARWLAEKSSLEIAVTDATSRPLPGARMTVELVRPVERRPPLPVEMSAIDIGRFAGQVDLPERGSWDVDIVVERGGERFALTRRMFLQ